ncbi:ciliary neurotrophic factor receptor subunit alpha [Platysternon megacephalum]|uniref:Ciliary neurotrophic factor receptor subunit alpha n=1 Tax=Platysternon megacephalum TaxID=55544 RepID=A0A4D9E447_9SAUR|nr:ciliary neurotrophic factor receptor subunit alpha [Platysternon megacephalum]
MAAKETEQGWMALFSLPFSPPKASQCRSPAPSSPPPSPKYLLSSLWGFSPSAQSSAKTVANLVNGGLRGTGTQVTAGTSVRGDLPGSGTQQRKCTQPMSHSMLQSSDPQGHGPWRDLPPEPAGREERGRRTLRQ